MSDAEIRGPLAPAAGRLDPSSEQRLADALWPAAAEVGEVVPPLVRPADPGGWDVLFRLPRPRSAVEFLDLNCVCDRTDPAGGVMSRRGPGDDRAFAAVRLPPGWRGTYRFLDLDALPAADDGAAWSTARARGHVAGADPGVVWPGAPFAPAAVFAVPDAPAPRWVPATRDRVGHERVDEMGALVLPDGVVTEVAVVRNPAGRGVAVVFDGLTFLHFGLADGLRRLPDPPAVVVALGRAGGRGRRSLLAADPRVRDVVLDHARELAGAAWRDGVVVAGCSLGGAAAVYHATRRVDEVAGVVALSGSFWMRDGRGRPVWHGLSGATPVHLAWGTCEFKLDGANGEARAALAGIGVPLTVARPVGGHDFAWWADELAEGYREVRRPSRSAGQ